MDKVDYYKAFESLGISIKPLPANYTPEEFGRRLLSATKSEHGVSYAASTDYMTIQQKSKK